MPEKGWDATGLLKPLWERLPGKRDELARITGIRGNTLSAYNNGRALGMSNALKIANALGVSVYDLGAPRLPENQFLASMLGQMLVELQRTAAAYQPVHLRELAVELRGVASALEAVADAQDDGALPSG